MNKFKKIMLGCVVAAGVSCLSGAAACSAPKYYRLTFEGSGIDFVLQDRLAEFENGGTVKKGVDVRFTVSLGVNTIGDPVISLSDGTTLTPDENGVYSFVMNTETKVTASGLNGIYTLTLDRFESVLGDSGQYVREERRITYLDENGNTLDDEVRLEGGSNFKFKLNISPYYVQKCSVSCGYEVLEADANGVYTVENITTDSTVTVSGLEQETSFAQYEDGSMGTGTEEDPYLISRPIDLYYMAALVNSDYYMTYKDKHYKLVNDIDMQGEQLFVIGDNSNANALFMGTFDGNNKTISNFYITDEVVDQSSYENAYLPYVGLFGNAVATTSQPVVIKNVTLKDYEVRVHPGESKSQSLVGSLLGSGIGVQITNCHAEGEVIAFGDDNQIVFMGGLAGYLQAAYANESGRIITYDSFVRSSSTDVNLEGTGSPRAAGGIVGYLYSTHTSAIAYVANSYSKGNIYGAMHAGGIVGTLGRFSSVTNCYSTSNVSASNTVASALVTSDYMVAYAGGIAGYADEDTVIASCYIANGRLSANSVHGASYQDTGTGNDAYGEKINGVVGHSAAGGSNAVDAAGVILYNNVLKRTGATAAMFTETLGWLANEWDFSGDLPEIVRSAAAIEGERELTIKIKGGNQGNFERVYTNTVSGTRPPVHAWYANKKLPVYETNDDQSKLSWGYYFDEALTRKVPYGFVPVAAETTLYAGFADYKEVAGRYYVSAATYSNGAYIELDDEGNVFFRNGGLNYKSNYYYNGDEILLADSALANLLYTMEEINGNYFTLNGVKNDGGFTLSGKAFLIDVANSTAESQTTVERQLNITVVKASDTFAYGEYLADNGATYAFNRGGTGVFINERKVRQSFTYSVSGGEVAIVYDGGNGGATATVADNKITKVGNVDVRLKDGFAGVWQTAANSGVKFEFDGFGNVKYSVNEVVKTATYTSDGKFSIGGVSYTASVDGDGLLDINGTKYYFGDGYTGTWYMTYEKERIEVTLEGIGKNGYGYATISYVGSVVTSLNAQYDIFTDSYGTSVRVYVDDVNYGELAVASTDKKASGIFYSMHKSSYYTNAQFYLYDNFRGTWVSNTEQIDTITFNGKSASGEAEVTVTAANGATSRGTYSLNGISAGVVTIGGEKYDLSFDELANKAMISVADGAQLARRDEWYGVTLYDGQTQYSFDGKGYVGGKVTVSGGTSLDYEFNGSSVSIEGEPLVPTANGFTLGGKNLVFKTGFVGEWLVSGTDYHLTLKEVDGFFNAKATYSDPAVTGEFNFVFDPSTNTLSYSEEAGGERIVTELNILGNDRNGYNEMSIRQSSLAGNSTLHCVRTSLVDEWKGTYTQGLTSWTFDGLGNCTYGSGTATFTAADGSTKQYNYRVNTYGVPRIEADGGLVFIESEKGYSGGNGKTYNTVTPDMLYEVEVIVVVPGGENLHYIFDGVSTLWRVDGNELVAAFSYKINTDNKTQIEVALTDKNDESVTYKGIVESRGMYYYLTLTQN